MKSKPKRKEHPSFSWGDTLWDIFCAASLVGIWPRFIEPNISATTKLNLPIANLPKELNNLHIVQISDLHLHRKVTDHFLNTLTKKINHLNPDILVFTGDFLCYSKIYQKERLIKFLNSFSTPYGCYAILGNHDYAKSVSISDDGEYDIVTPTTNLVKKGFQMLLLKTKLKGSVTERAKQVAPHKELQQLLKETPFQLLDNETRQIPIRSTAINLCGLGEYTLGRTLPEQALKNYDTSLPGIILVHNPDSIPLLKKHPGDLILSGHTHGGQINLPFLWNRFTLMEIPKYKRGLFRVEDKWFYVSRGIGSVMPFRFGSIPEIVSIKLKVQP